MSYAIIRMQKMKSPAIKGIQFHNQRERESETNPDIEEAKSHLNYDLHNEAPIDYLETINKKIEDGVDTGGKKIRKDAVRLCEFLITSDKSYFDGLTEEREKEFFEKAYEFIEDRYGKENIVYATVHKDEKTPHLHVGFVPITEDQRLSAKEFFGQKKQLVQLQDDFHKHLKDSGFELDRGTSSDKKHITQARFKAETLEKQAKEYEKKIQEIEKLQAQIKKVESIEVKNPLFQRDYVQISKTDFENMQNQLKKGIATRDDRDELVETIERAKKEISGLKSDNLSLKKKLARSEEYKGFLTKSLSSQEQKNKQLEEENGKLKGQLKKIAEFATASVKAMLKEAREIDSSRGIEKRLLQAYTSFKNTFSGKDKGKAPEELQKDSETKLKRSKDKPDFEIGE
ncbi:MobV family relaxase [Rossellomorea arthrocnemi]|uniref:MobV family relaxase n=1 Tax=Rossellomorea arthrocnemi TaxID=2769542 RepID=UPI001E434761|nr:MobV family relaxase [Rossellomorea arthrocnemi]